VEDVGRKGEGFWFRVVGVGAFETEGGGQGFDGCI